MSLFPLQFRLADCQQPSIRGAVSLSPYPQERRLCGMQRCQTPCSASSSSTSTPAQLWQKTSQRREGRERGRSGRENRKRKELLKVRVVLFRELSAWGSLFHYRAPQGYTSKVCMFIHLINDSENSLCLVSASSTVNYVNIFILCICGAVSVW